MKILVTGASGFVGKALVYELIEQQYSVRVALRTVAPLLKEFTDKVIIGNISETTVWASALSNIDVIIHLAARVHVMNDLVNDPLVAFKKVNTTATLNLANQAAKSGVKRFIFISSIKVNGEETELDFPFKPDDNVIPDDPYGFSKYEAEKGLLDIAKQTNMEVVIIRPPLVYGPSVKGNFASMINWIKKGIPLPFRTVRNQRSLVALDNLIDFIMLCVDREKSPKAANQVFLLSDGEDVSTPELLQKVAKAYGVKSRLLSIPVGLMKVIAKLLGKSAVADRLFSNLQVDSSKARDLLGWKPIVTMDEQLRKMATSEQDKK